MELMTPESSLGVYIHCNVRSDINSPFNVSYLSQLRWSQLPLLNDRDPAYPFFGPFFNILSISHLTLVYPPT